MKRDEKLNKKNQRNYWFPFVKEKEETLLLPPVIVFH